jgi:N-acetylmuramoyl-L-alanine amidase
MEHIERTGVLVECGFLSNPEEEAKLRDSSYQQKLCCVIAATVAAFLSNT